MVKTKPTKHKSENTFKFQNFSERLAAVNVDIVHRVDLKRNTVPEETETFFYECLEKWSDLNLTEGYTGFCRRLGRGVQSLGQLILHQDRVLQLLLKQIDKENVLFLEPILELVVAVARDLQSDFYPKFPLFFKQLAGLLEARDPQVIEWAFTTLAYLYKNLWRALVKDVKNVYELLLPLLGRHRPEHVRQFASESFAFIGRKVSDHQAFVRFVFSKLAENPEDSSGVGQLLFQLVKGVKNQFHTCLDTMLPIYFQSLGSPEGDWEGDAVFQAVQQCFLFMAKHTSPAHCSRVWKLLLVAIDSAKKPGISGLLLLILQWISFKEGELITDSVAVANTLTLLMKVDNLTEGEQGIVARATAALMKSTKSLLTLDQMARLGSAIYTSHWEPKTLLDLTLQVASHSTFESHLLPHFTSYCHSIGNSGRPESVRVIESIARLATLKSPLPKYGFDMDSSKAYPIEFSFAMRKAPCDRSVPQLIESILEGSVEAMVGEDFPLYANSLVCLPHVRPIDKARATGLLKRIITEVTETVVALQSDEPPTKRMKTNRPEDFVEKLGVILNLAVLGFRHFSSSPRQDLPWDVMKAALLDKITSQSPCFLRAADFYLATLHETEAGEGDDFFCSLDTLTELYDTIGHNIYSPYREVRLLALHMLSLFSPPMPPPPENVQPSPVFAICLRAEMVPATVTEQREKYNHLHHLEAGRVAYSLPLGGHFIKVPLQYMLSQLYVNFRPLWEPVLKLIESHAFNMDPTRFWSVYLPFMDHLRQHRHQEVGRVLPEVEHLDLFTAPERLDIINARSLVWGSLARFGSIAEKEHAILVPLFLDFWHNEYCVNDAHAAQTQDLTGEAPPAEGEQTPKDKRGNVTKLLSAYLSVLASFSRPHEMTREPEVTAILLRLLSHRLGDVQKLALNCLVAYNYPFLMPYKDNMYRLLNDKTFRSELVSFSIDAANSSVQADHRPGLISILVRILYGKMMQKSGTGSSGKENVQQRQAIILRYLAGLAEAEIELFLELAFQLFGDFGRIENVLNYVLRIINEVDATKALPLKRVQGALVMLGTMFSKLGNHIKSNTPKLLNILLSISAHVTGLLNRRTQCQGKHVALLKTLRTLCLQRVSQFFTRFETYPWSPLEIEAVFHVCIWPQIEQLPNEALNSPTPLMRLFQVWSTIPRYFILFGKMHPQRSEVNVLSPLLALLVGGKANAAVCSFIMDIVDKLVSTTDYGSQEEESANKEESPVYITPDFCIGWQPDSQTTGAETSKPNLGTTLLIPHMLPIIIHLRKYLTRGLKDRDLNVLMRISEHVTEAELSKELARLLIPVLKGIVGRSRNTSAIEERVTCYVDTLANLLKSVDKARDFVNILCPLFGGIDGRIPRQSLCRVLDVVCQREPSLAPLGQLSMDLNSWDPQRLDQPHYNLRLDTHKQINLVLETDSAESEWITLVLYNSFHAVRVEEDVSLRDNASYSLQKMTIALNKLECGKRILFDHFLPQLRLLLRSTNEAVRHEGVAILGQAVKNCADISPALASLQKLRKSGDAETDFFENSRHLQIQRRSRGLLRLAMALKQDRTSISEETIIQFLMPLVTCYLFTEAYESHIHLIDASIDCLYAVSRCLAWPNYEKLLRVYLAKMTRRMQHQKQAVKAVIAILNGFHFDLKQSQFKTKSSATTKKTAQASECETEEGKPVEEDALADDADAFEPVSCTEEESTRDTSVETATKIHATIAQQLLPQLHNILTARSKKDVVHKANKKDGEVDDDEILKVPIAVALVNLLKNLPAGALEPNLPGMLSKVCTFLKSRSIGVRETSRNTLMEIVISLGPQYLSTLMEAAAPLLQRGYQVHVYIFTMHALLVRLEATNQLKAGSLDPIVYSLVELCKKELYGDTADEKEVEQIVNKLKEAKGVKAFNTLKIAAKYVSQSHMLQLILPLKEILASTKSYKMTKKVEECLYNVALGLTSNTALTIEQLLIFVHGVVSFSIPQLQLPAPKKVEDPYAVSTDKPLRTDSLIIAPVPKRKVAAAAQPSVSGFSKTAYTINSHFLAEFGFLILSLVLRKDCDPKLFPMLDPIIPIAHRSLNDPHSKLVAVSLRCTCTLLRMPLPSVSEYASKFASSLFTLLHKFAGNTSGENLEMIETAFKAVSVLIRHVHSYTISEDQLRVLLSYAEQALFDPKQQAISFGVIKSILKRKLDLEELPDVMLKVSELAIRAEALPVRAQSRKLVLQYLVDYPLGKKVTRYLDFFLGQVEYEKESGRLSAIHFLISVFQTFPKRLLSQQCALFFIKLSPQLVNETSTSCSKAITAALRGLIEQLNTPTASTLFDICLTWLKESDLLHKRLAVQLFGIFVTAEAAKFEFRLKVLLPELIKLMDRPHSDIEDRDADLLLIQAHYTIIKITQSCPLGLQTVENADLVDDVWHQVVHHLTHPHLWIRTLSARLVGILLGWHKAGVLASYAAEPTDSTVARTYLLCPDVANRLRALASNSVSQLQSELLDKQLADQVIKNLVFIGKVAARIPAAEQEKGSRSKLPTLAWLTGKLRREVNEEVALHPLTSIKRVTVFKWMAAVAVDLHKVAGKDGVIAMLKFFVPPLTRDINDDGAPEEAKSLALEVAGLLKKLVGTEAYSQSLVAADRRLAVRRRERISARKAEAVLRPEKTALLRIKKHLAKRVAKKVKFAKIKGVKPKLAKLSSAKSKQSRRSSLLKK